MADSSKRLRIAVLFGGRSAEHEVSVLSATNVMLALDPARYDSLPIFVTRNGQWLLSSFESGGLATPSSGTEVCLLPGGRGRMMAIPGRAAAYALPAIDIVFPVLHGLHGEDGAVQGIVAAARIALAGCGILGSATALDKDIAKRLFGAAGLPTARSVTIHRRQPPTFVELRDTLGAPIFIKPARQGSSVGIRRIATERECESAFAEAFCHDDKLLAEAFVEGREIECGVLEDADGSLFVSRPGEIVAATRHGFYSYEAKYVDASGAALHVPAELPEAIEGRMRAMAAEAFRALGCDGMARVDFFLRPDMSMLVNEVNTIPGFTDISMYAKAMAASGVAYRQLIDRIVAHGLSRAT